jgi:hypothetical protein
MKSKLKPLKELFQFPFVEAMFGRRARRFGLGMEILSGLLQDTSPHTSQNKLKLNQL